MTCKLHPEVKTTPNHIHWPLDLTPWNWVIKASDRIEV